MKRYIDLTHRIEPGMVVFPGDPQPEFREIMTLGKDICTVQSIKFNNHIGTHLDAPSHFVDNGMTVDQIPLDTLMGKAIILDFTDKGENGLIRRKDLEKHHHILDTRVRVLLKTGWDENFTSPAYYEDFPCITLEAAEFLVARKIRLLGMDTPSPSPLDEPDQAIHKTLLGAGIIIVESLKNLTAIHTNECELIILPLPIKDFSGTPCRAVAAI
jgi:kynurenine formamidase